MMNTIILRTRSERLASTNKGIKGGMMTIVYAMRCVSKPREQVYSPLFCMEGSGSPRGERDEGGGRGKFRGVGLEGERGKSRDRWGLGWEVWKRERGPRRGNY